MPTTYDVVVEDGFIRVFCRGRQDFETTNKVIAEAARLATRTGMRSVMFDFAMAEAQGYSADAVRYGEMAAELGVALDLRLAFYSPTDFSSVDFMETVARNRGYDARAFRDEQKAIKWLRGQDRS